jgi:gustatory receptor
MSTVLLNNQQIIENCRVNESEFFRSYLIAYRQHLVDVIPYHIAMFPLYEWVNILMTFSWNFMDLLIVLISIGLTTRFSQINRRLVNGANAGGDVFWNEIRTHYYSLIDLVDEIDEQFSMLILISTGHNVFSLCTSIFESLMGNNGKYAFERVFFWYSFFFMITRCFSALFCASKVNETAKITRDLIRVTPSQKWNSDVSVGNIPRAIN